MGASSVDLVGAASEASSVCRFAGIPAWTAGCDGRYRGRGCVLGRSHDRPRGHRITAEGRRIVGSAEGIDDDGAANVPGGVALDGAQHVSRILRRSRVSRLLAAPVFFCGSGNRVRRALHFASLRYQPRLRRRSGNDRDHRVRRDVLRVGVLAQEPPARDDRACVARYFQWIDACAVARLSSVEMISFARRSDVHDVARGKL